MSTPNVSLSSPLAILLAAHRDHNLQEGEAERALGDRAVAALDTFKRLLSDAVASNELTAAGIQARRRTLAEPVRLVQEEALQRANALERELNKSVDDELQALSTPPTDVATTLRQQQIQAQLLQIDPVPRAMLLKAAAAEGTGQNRELLRAAFVFPAIQGTWSGFSWPDVLVDRAGIIDVIRERLSPLGSTAWRVQLLRTIAAQLRTELESV